MSYQIFPNILFIFAVLGILLIILRHLPDAAEQGQKKRDELPVEAKLHQKGLPAVAFSKFASVLKLWTKHIWNFVLEAKDLKPTALTGYKIKKIFGNKAFAAKAAKQAAPANTSEIKDENYFLAIIKREPKNYSSYDLLGKFYLERNNFTDARDIYQYLANHQPTNSDYAARLAYACYQLHFYDQAVTFYERSLALDSSQPNRYYNLGLSQDALGQPEKAKQSLQKAISLETGNSKYYVSLSNIYTKLGNKDKAKEKLEEALLFDSENEIVKTKLKSLA